MKKMIICCALAVVLLACSDSANKSKTSDPSEGVDTSIIGSDNPNPIPDTTFKTDSLNN